MSISEIFFKHVFFLISGEVCIHMAAKDRHFDIIRHLVWYGADINARVSFLLTL